MEWRSPVFRVNYLDCPRRAPDGERIRSVTGKSVCTCLGLAGALATVSCMFETRTQPPPILFLGNSITRAIENDSVGWPQDAGMASSSRALDYVHQTERILREKGMDVAAVLGSRDCGICDGVIG